MAKDVTYPAKENDLYDELGIERGNHEELTKVKKQLHKQVKDKLKGQTNGDIGWDNEGNIHIRPRGTKLDIPTGANLKD
jgi:hypothetical protein